MWQDDFDAAHAAFVKPTSLETFATEAKDMLAFVEKAGLEALPVLKFLATMAELVPIPSVQAGGAVMAGVLAGASALADKIKADAPEGAA